MFRIESELLPSGSIDIVPVILNRLGETEEIQKEMTRNANNTDL